MRTHSEPGNDIVGCRDIGLNVGDVVDAVVENREILRGQNALPGKVSINGKAGERIARSKLHTGVGKATGIGVTNLTLDDEFVGLVDEAVELQL